MGSTRVDSGSSELFEQYLTRFNQISSLNKPQNTNKHFAYWILRQKMGQLCEIKPSGVHYDLGQTKGQWFKPGRRGLGEPNLKVWDPLMSSERAWEVRGPN